MAGYQVATDDGIAWGRDERDPCERGTVGCAVKHDGEDRECETW